MFPPASSVVPKTLPSTALVQSLRAYRKAVVGTPGVGLSSVPGVGAGDGHARLKTVTTRYPLGPALPSLSVITATCPV